MGTHTTITVSTEVKRRLAEVKGDRSWDEFLAEVADEHLEDLIALAQERLVELRHHKAHLVSIEEAEARLAARKATEARGSRPRRGTKA